MAAAYAALLSVTHIIDNSKHHPLHTKQAHLLTEKLTFLLKFLQGYNPHLAYTQEADPLETRIADAAYAAEDAIESYIVDQITNGGEKINSDALYDALETVIEEMALIQEAIETKQTLGVQNQLNRNSMISDSSRSSSISSAQKSSMVGADEALYDLMDKLTSHCRDLQIIPIVGMGGTGKTTLALNVYLDRRTKLHFYICAWATISQEYSIREILMQLLHQLNVEVDQGLNESELGNKLHQHLFARKFLFVLDDIWSIDAWDRVRRYFPNNKNGSRIVITTRLSSLGSKLPDSNSLEMKLLDEAHSWELLSTTVFGGKGCPLELEEIGKKIGKGCKGLPLSIVVVGGFLAKSEHTKEFWEYIEDNINSIVNSEDDERCLKILHLSYKQLPMDLKPCFLYMGVFPEDKMIRVSKMIKLWVAEGFLKPVRGRTLEEVAKGCLMELIGRNLILIDEIGKTGNIKCCKIHDLMRDLCLREAEKERFYIDVARLAATPQEMVKPQRRIVISRREDINALSSMSLARSLMWGAYQKLPRLNFRLLRILGSCHSSANVDKEFLENVHQFVNTRFLDISAFYKFPSIRQFWNLQTLILVGQIEFTAPTDIWYMPHIRHLQCQCLYLPDPPNGHDDIVLENLQTLGLLMDFKFGEQVIKRIPNIKKLRLCYVDVADLDRYCLSNLDRLDKLESLSVNNDQIVPNSLHTLINYPHSLSKLTLIIHPSQCWDDVLDRIGVLPLLQKLTLTWGRFKGGRWETGEGQFPSLRFLALYYLRELQLWTTESSHFPCLEHLLLDRADELKEIPLCLAEISSLRVIDIKCCSNSSVVSARRILEEQEELYGEAALQVQVLLSNKDQALESLAAPNFRVQSE